MKFLWGVFFLATPGIFCQVYAYLCMLDNQRLTKVPNSCVMCGVQTHRHLLRVAHLFPENCFIGQKERLPGVVVGTQKHPKFGGKNMSFFTIHGILPGPTLVAEWVKPPAAVHAGQGSLPAWVIGLSTCVHAIGLFLDRHRGFTCVLFKM